MFVSLKKVVVKSVKIKSDWYLFKFQVNWNTVLPFSNWGTENDPEQNYHNGNTDPRGFGMWAKLTSNILGKVLKPIDYIYNKYQLGVYAI